MTHSWNHMEESQAVSASHSKLIPDSHKGVLRKCLATLPEQASLRPSMALTYGAFLDSNKQTRHLSRALLP